jgi:tol-pal system protein YbgF
VRTLQVQIDELRAAQASVADAIARLDSLSRDERGGTHELVVSLKHTVSDFEERLFQMDARVADLDQRVGGPAQDAPRVISPSVTTPSEAWSDPGAAASVSGGKRLYHDAFEALNQENHDVAVSGFRAFIEQFPDAPEAASAVYWIGESFFAMGSLDSALGQFQIVLDRYSESDKVPAALLKSGNIYTEQGDKKSAYPYYRRLKEEFPQSLEYQLLRKSLEE